MRIRICLLALLLPCTADVRGDTVELTTGGRLRGIDLKKTGDLKPKGQSYVFTLETGEVVYLKAAMVGEVTVTGGREKVEFRGREVTLRQKIRELQAERRVAKRKALGQIEQWARGGGKAEAARVALFALPEEERATFFESALGESRTPEARRLAAEQLSLHSSPRATGALVHAAVRDRDRGVRDASLRSLRIRSAMQRAAPRAAGATSSSGSSSDREEDATAGIARRFTPYLKSASRSDRIHAANALAAFPSRHAMPELIRTLRLSWSGFGRAAAIEGTQRAYIGDYELVSGGTGFSIVEVADPVVRTAQTGSVLDVKVVRVELIARLRAMRTISGQDFGADVAEWQRWWNAHGAGAD